ncbi:MAG TPA: thioredoxin family protein, partial [Candidatus Akkermansia intestinigallinarum]|nr:thioredoxin family protein [Candidatus Akkermansia intestinigallinarum]
MQGGTRPAARSVGLATDAACPFSLMPPRLPARIAPPCLRQQRRGFAFFACSAAQLCQNEAMHKMLFSMMSLAAIVAPAFAAEWLTDLEAAKKQAAAENKAILVDFTGSDWCGYCIR